MRFDEHEAAFRKIDRRYAELRREHEAGLISIDEFDAQLKQLMAQDSEGRWWAKSRGTGEWHYFNGNVWVPGTPPVYQPNHQPAPEQPRLSSEHLVQDQTSPLSQPARSNRPLLIRLSFAAMLLLGVGIGTVAALTLLRDGAENQNRAAFSPATTQQEDAAAGKQPAAQEKKDESEEPTLEEAPQKKVNAGAPSREQTPRPAPGYNLIQTPDEGLAVEVPSSWEIQTGANSEGEGTNWSYYVGETLTSSITTAPSLDTWYSTGTSGVYMVAAKTLAQYSDYELTNTLLFANRSGNCTTTGAYEDYNRPPYSGKIQTWHGCGQDGATTYAVTAAPEGRECVAVFDMRVSDEAHREAVQHILDSFEVDCGRVTS